MAVPPFRISRLDFSPAPLPAWTDAVYAQSINVWLALSPEGAAGADKVLRSTDGLTWAEQTLPAGADWSALVWSEDAGLFAAFCTNNTGISVATSPDGITWTNRHAEQAAIRSCTYGQSKFIGVGGQRQTIAPTVFSTLSFANQGLLAFSRSLSVDLVDSSLLFVCIVGNLTDTLTAVTQNGVACTFVSKVQVTGDRWIYFYKRVAPDLGGSFNITASFAVSAPASNQGCSIFAAGYENADDITQFAATTGSGATIATALTTTVDESWMAQFSCNIANSAGTAGAHTTVRATSDGEGGTFADSEAPFLGGALTPPGSHTVTVSVTAGAWAAIAVAFRPSPTLGLITSAGGVAWTESEVSNDTLQAVAYSPALGLFCAISGDGNGGGLGDTFLILTSPNGSTWTRRDLGTSVGADLSATGSCVLVWADDLGLFCAVLSNGTVRASADGSTWFELTLPVDALVPQVLGVTWAKRLGALVFFTDASTVGLKPLLYCEDGATIVAVPRLTIAGTDTDYTCGAYSPVDDRMVVFPTTSDYALLVEFGPDVISVSPAFGQAVGGNTVDVIGTGFMAGAEVVFDNRFATDVVVVSELLIQCTVPAHAAGFVSVTVTNPDDRFDTGVDLYEYQEPIDPDTGLPEVQPLISWMGSGCAPGSIVPAHGTMAGGTPVTIHGQGFRAGSQVYFGGELATSVVIDVSGTFLTCMTPAHQTGAVDVEIISP